MVTHTKQTPHSNFDAWSKKASMEDAEKLMASVKEGKIIDYVNQYWGHAFYPEKHGEMFWKGMGFYTFVFSTINVGDFFLFQINDDKIGKFVVADIEFSAKSKGMFYAYLIGIDYDYKLNK